MKKAARVLVGILLIFTSLGSVWAQSSLAATDSLVGSPRLLQPGSRLHITGDSVYLIGKQRYRFYQKLHRYLADSTTGSACLSLITSYEHSLQETQRAYEHLLQQYRAADSLSARTLYSTQVSLGQLGRSLDQANDTLEQTVRALAQAEEQLQREQRRSFFRQLGCGAAGVGVGLLLMALLW